LTFFVILAKLVLDLIGEPEASIFNRLWTPFPAIDHDPGFALAGKARHGLARPAPGRTARAGQGQAGVTM